MVKIRIVELFKIYNFYLGSNSKTQRIELYFNTLDLIQIL
jgi:hypothetical protein